MNLINIIQWKQKLHHTKYNKRLSKQIKKQAQTYQIQLQSNNLTDYTIKQQTSLNFINDQPNKKAFLNTITQTDYYEEKQQLIPEQEIKKINQMYELFRQLENVKYQHKNMRSMTENISEQKLVEHQFEIQRLEQELELIPKIDYQLKLKEQEEELQILEQTYVKLCEEHGQLQRQQDKLKERIQEQVHFQ